MKIFIRYCVLVLLIGCTPTQKADNKSNSQKEKTKEVVANIPSLKFEIYQNGKVVKPKSSIIKLKKSPFIIKFEVTKAEGIFLQASYSEDWYQLKDNELIPDRAYISPKAMAEENFNTDKDLIISNEYYASWFFDEKEDWYRMSRAKKTSNGFKAEVDVENLFIREPTKKVIKVEEANQPIYLFVFIPDEGNQEYVRLKYKIEWK
ncbi:MAG: hypothetical protein ACPG19_12175 [Saprospiraceae bacterium]